MNFRIGDKVCFLNEKGEGVISGIKANGNAMVTIEDGFEMEFPGKHLVLLQRLEGLSPLIENNDEPIEPKVHNQINKIEIRDIESKLNTVFLSIEPENERNIGSSGLNLVIYNRTDFEVLLTFSKEFDGIQTTVDFYKISPKTAAPIDKLHKNKLHEYETMVFQGVFFKKGNNVLSMPINKRISIDKIKLFKESSFKKYNFTLKSSYILPIASREEERHFDDLYNMGDKSGIANKISIPNKIKVEEEVDLHIDTLLDDHSGMQNFEIIKVQIDHFRKKLDAAFASDAEKITFIHGVGNGKLRNEIHSILHAENIKFMDGSYNKYGFGATTVLLK